MRCADCLDDLPPVHFVVLDAADPFDPYDIDEKHVCRDCAGWYSNAMEVTS